MHKSIFFALLFLTLASCQGVEEEEPRSYDELLEDNLDDEPLGYDYDYAAEGGEAAGAIDDNPGEFFAQPQHEVKVVGESVTFSCEGDGAKTLQIYRKKRGKEDLLFAGVSKIIQDPRYSLEGSDLTITQVNRMDHGKYQCLYQSAGGNVNITHDLDVQFKPVIIKRKNQKGVVKIAVGHNLQVACRANGNPKPVVSWTKTSGHAPATPFEDGNVLALGAATRDMAGDYECEAVNSVGTVIAQRSVEVMFTPEVHMAVSEVHTGVGDSVELNCTVYAFPAANVTWFKDGETVMQEQLAVVDNEDGGHIHSLPLGEITEEDLATYKCFAENESGEDFVEVVLTDIPSTPTIESLKKSSEDGTHTLVWSTQSFYPISSYSLMYRREKANDSSDEPGEWVNIEVAGEDVQEYEQRGKYYRSFMVELPSLDEDAEYEVSSLSAQNTQKASLPLNEYFFSTTDTAAEQEFEEEDTVLPAAVTTEEAKEANSAFAKSPVAVFVGCMAVLSLLVC